jgi:hypothetical protein
MGCAQPGEFIALTRDFDGWEDWDFVEVTPEAEPDAPHPPVPRTVYSNVRSPRRGPWDVGSILVKVHEEDEDPGAWTVFAMAKRGGAYNAEGLAGWEWFDLTIGDSGRLLVEWRGSGPPTGSQYGPGTGQADCNTCHALAARDGVFTTDMW